MFIVSMYVEMVFFVKMLLLGESQAEPETFEMMVW